MHSKVSSDWMPNYITAMRLVLEIFKMALYIPDSLVFCFMIILKYPTLISSNNANERMWMVLTGLDEVFMSCKSVYLLLICETL